MAAWQKRMVAAWTLAIQDQRTALLIRLSADLDREHQTLVERLRDDIVPASSGEVEQLRSRIEELRQQLALRDQRIAALERQAAESERRIRELTRQLPAANEPADDGLGIPGFLRRIQ